MATALSATFQAGSTTDPAQVLLSVTGAPTPTVPYTSAFSLGNVDGWTGSAGTALAFSAGYLYGGVMIPVGMRITTAAETVGTFSRTVTGLTIGQTYTLSMMALATTGKISLGVTGMTFGTDKTAPTRAALSYTFTATATSHVIKAIVTPPVTTGTDYGQYRLDTIKVARTSGWLGTTITRTDANGTDVLVRLAPGQDAVGTSGSATMTVTDYEAALTGTVQYMVYDGLGAVAYATVVNSGSPGVWLTLPATSNPATPTAPSFVQALLVTGFGESSDSSGSVHKIVGRADPIANPGPLSLRSGSMDVWCTDYAAAKAVRTLLANGDVAQLRQPTYPGMDLYLVATKVAIKPEEATDGTRRWTTSLDYVEVVAP